MKKLLVSLGAIALTATPLTVVACSSDKTEETIKDEAKTPEQQLEAVDEKMTELTARGSELAAKIYEINVKIQELGGDTTSTRDEEGEDNSELEALQAEKDALITELNAVDGQITFLISEKEFINTANTPGNEIGEWKLEAFFSGKFTSKVWLNKSWFNEEGKIDLSKLTDEEISKMFYKNIFNSLESAEQQVLMFDIQGIAASLKITGFRELVQGLTLNSFGDDGKGIVSYNKEEGDQSAESVSVELKNDVRTYGNKDKDDKRIIKSGSTSITNEFEIHLHDDTNPA
ncbi:hypothetical protein [Mesoplasma photuris]|uniref:hypothetical protein n=1 Tax=Mesoplasma photuris TaxID=217731 RepID=UPI0004E1C53C|nr:hypothetical protein [Mesoplasma photuris]